MEKRNLLSLLLLSVALHVMAEETGQDSDDFSYEIIGANSASDSSPEKGNYQHVGVFHSRPVHSRQRRSPHFGGHGLYHGYHHRPYPHHYPHHHYQPHGWGGHHGNSHSHSQAQAISANFGGPHWNAGFSGAAASSGSGGGSNHFGHGK